MENFQEKNLIISLNNNIYQLDNIIQVISLILGETYNHLNEEEKLLKRYDSLLPFSVENKLLIASSLQGVFKERTILDNSKIYSLEKDLFIDDEITYLLSLCRIDQIQILEKTEANIFATNLANKTDGSNYILINKFTNEILKNYIERRQLNN